MSEAVGVQLGRRIKELREAARLTQSELASLSLKSVETISNFERGKTMPSIHTLASLSEHLNCSMDDFFNSIPSPREVDDKTILTIASRTKLLTERDKVLLLGFVDLLLANSRR